MSFEFTTSCCGSPTCWVGLRQARVQPSTNSCLARMKFPKSSQNRAKCALRFGCGNAKTRKHLFPGIFCEASSCSRSSPTSPYIPARDRRKPDVIAAKSIANATRIIDPVLASTQYSRRFKFRLSNLEAAHYGLPADQADFRTYTVRMPLRTVSDGVLGLLDRYRQATRGEALVRASNYLAGDRNSQRALEIFAKIHETDLVPAAPDPDAADTEPYSLASSIGDLMRGLSTTGLSGLRRQPRD